MKKMVILFFGIAIVLFLGGAVFYRQSFPVSEPMVSPTPLSLPVATAEVSPTSNQPSYCLPTDLGAIVNLEGAAGNIYGTVTITNTSAHACQIIGSNFVQASFVAKNLSLATQGQPGPATLTLAPQQAVYSQIHYPNGPQCSGQIQNAAVTFSYKISATDSVEIKNQNGDTMQTIGVCSSLSESTTIDGWSISQKPVNQ